MREVAIIGIGQVAVDEHWHLSIKDLAGQAIISSLDDGGRNSAEAIFIGKKLSETVDLSPLKLQGKGQITGGSSKTGFPMVPFVEGSANKKVLLGKGLAFKPKHKGEKKRTTVFGNTVNENVEQINIKILELDPSVNLDELFPKQETKK